MIKTIQNTTKAIIVLLMINYIGQPKELYAATNQIKLSYKAKNVSCYGAADGSIQMEIKGGKAPYQIQWSDGVSQQNLLNIKAGNYVVSVTDKNGNTATQTINITEPYPLNIHSQTSPESCFSKNGSANIIVTGGTQPYTYTWSDNIHDQNLEKVSAGSYEVRVVDVNGCNKIANIMVERSKVLDVVVAKYNPVCFGDDNGLIDLEVRGGKAPYTYTWSNGAVTEDVSGLKAGSYHAVVKDNNGCTSDIDVKLVNPEPIKIHAVVTDAEINKSNGTIALQVTGGNGRYSYLWSNMEESATLNNVEEGVYAVRVTDGNQCMGADYFTVNEKSPIQVTYQVKHVVCNGATSGSVKLNVSGGTKPYTYEWSDGSTGSAINNKAAGEYKVVILDAAGKKYSNTFNIKQPEVMSVLATVKDETIQGAADGQIALQILGGMPPYAYIWSDGVNSKERMQLPQGIYAVVIKDGNGCLMNHQVMISTGDQMQTPIAMRKADDNIQNGNMMVFPNPFLNTFSIRMNEPAGEIQSIKLYSVEGKLIQSIDLNLTTTEANEITVNTKEILPGNYLIKVSTINNTYTRLITRSR
ncbi:MAG: T9SS type A sorting domain-containing protein [Bacteroidetes bacterium]|jgi:hypothetical protein|nr:T9SS type A sorting domain-containing protein [Bacteroidota bacterium]